MRFSTIWLSIYFVITAIFLGVNWEYTGALFSTNLIFKRVDIQMVLILALFSFLWMLALVVIDMWQVEKSKREIEGLKAKLHDEELRAVKMLKDEIRERLETLEKSIMERIDQLEATIPRQGVSQESDR